MTFIISSVLKLVNNNDKNVFFLRCKISSYVKLLKSLTRI